VKQSTEVIIVGPSDVWRSIGRRVDGDYRVLTFATLEEFDRWRRTGALENLSIYPDLVAALIELGLRFGDLPARLRSALEALGRETRVPPLRRLKTACSRSAFYRTWRAHMEIAPATFLRRVRALHAARLIAAGCSKKQAALLAGYSSVDQMRRNMRRH
jgi:hypothetical protein